MKLLHSETARCLGQDCRERETCARYTQRGTPQRNQVTIGRGDIDPVTGKCRDKIEQP